MSGWGFMVLGMILTGVGILGLSVGMVMTGRKKQKIKEDQQIQEEGL